MIPKTIYYNGNVNIKKAGVHQEYTPEQLAEYIKCKDDPIYFIKNYVKIVSLDEGLVKFDMWEFQERMIETFFQERWSINLLPRQMGKTITVAAFILHYAIFNSQKSVGILANKGATAREILSRVKRMIENLPFFLQPGVKEYNKGSVEFGNGSSVMAAGTSNDAIRGFSFNVVYLDEFAFVDNADEFFTSTYPVISSGKDTKVIITSTPNGMNLFYKLWTEANSKRNKFVPIKVHWNENPNRDEKWKEETLANIGQRQFDQEYGCSFFGSSGTLISGEKLACLTWEDPIQQDDKMSVYENPIEGHTYIATVDVAEGVGSDFSVIHITDITEMPYRQVLVYRDNRVSPIVLTEVTERLATKYNDAYILVETNSIGSQVGVFLHNEYEYENLIITSVKAQENVISGGFSGSATDYGLRTTKKSKRIGCTNLKTLVEEDILLIRDFETVSELQTFSSRGQSYEAEDGKHDDIVMTLVLLGWISTQDYFIDLVNNDARAKTMENRMSQIEAELTPFGFIQDGDIDRINSDESNGEYGLVGGMF
jgi:hypothetical protein